MMTTTYLTRLPDGRLAARTSREPGRWAWVLALPDDTLLWASTRKAADAAQGDHPDAHLLPLVELPYSRARAERVFRQVQELVEAHQAAQVPAQRRAPRQQGWKRGQRLGGGWVVAWPKRGYVMAKRVRKSGVEWAAVLHSDGSFHPARTGREAEELGKRLTAGG